MVTAITAYPVAGKRKAHEICLAFIRGCGGQIGTSLRDGAAVFYGIDDSNVDVWRAVRARGTDYFYIDNSVFDSQRGIRFRVAKNRVQHNGMGTSDCARFRAHGIEIKPWRAAGEHLVVCPQSDDFMRTIAGYEGNWANDAMAALRARTARPLRLRAWNRDKAALAATLHDDLRGAHALVTWSSAAAVTALLEGVPVIVQGNDCVARFMGGNDIEDLPMPEREAWAGVLADNEWTLDEMQRGEAWAKLQA